MKKSIAILELYQHDEVVRHYCNLLQDSDYQLKIYCSKYVLDGLKISNAAQNVEFSVMMENQSIANYLLQEEKKLGEHDLVIISTVLNEFKAFLPIVKQVNTALIIHNLHSFLAPKKYLRIQHWKDVLRLAKVRFNKSHHYKSQILSKLKTIIFPTEELRRHALQLDLNLENKKSIVLPFASFDDKTVLNVSSNSSFTITIPGSVSTEVRNYELVIASIKSISKSQPNIIKLILLGKVMDQDIINRFKLIKNISLIYFDHYISNEEYNKCLRATNILILPIKQNGRNHIYNEKMGYSKISGTVNDAIRYGIPTLIPQFYPIPFGWNEIFKGYKEDDLEKIILGIVENNVQPDYRIPRSALFKTQKNHFLASIEQIL